MRENISMWTERRRDFRYQTIAKVRIPGSYEGEALLKDLSITGSNVECTSYADIQPHTRYRLEVIPESAAGVGVFDLVVESMWVRARDYSCEIGFFIIESPKGKLFQRYVDYLAWRYSMGNSMTGDDSPGSPSGASTEA